MAIVNQERIGKATDLLRLGRPAVKLPLEVYTPEREREFDAAEAELGQQVATRARRGGRAPAVPSPTVRRKRQRRGAGK